MTDSDLQKGDERANKALDQLRKIMQQWEDRLTIGNLRLAERYLEGQLELFIHLRSGLPGHSTDFCAILMNQKTLGETVGGGSVRGVDGFERQHETDHLSPPSMFVEGRIPEVLKNTGNNDEQPVFVEIIEGVENQKRIMRTVIRLASLDETYRSRAYSPYLSRRAGFVFGRSLKDGKVGALASGIPVCLNQLPRQVVEAAPQLVNDLSDDNGDFLRRLRTDAHAKDSLSRLRVIIAKESVWVGFPEGQNTTFEITDVVFGPFDFCPDTT